MTTKNDGGPAFPCDSIIRRDEKGHMHGHEISSAGLSVRDHFAGLVLPWFVEQAADSPSQGLTWQQVAARGAYTMADAMLAARSAA